MRVYRFLSWGVGTQSTALAVMSVNGDIEPFDAIITADTQNERAATYEARDYYADYLTKRGARVVVVTGGDVVKQGAFEHVHIPFWTSNGGPLQRQCTRHFKIIPMRCAARVIAGFDPAKQPHPKPGQFEVSLGISLDEWTRAKRDLKPKYERKRYPLLEMRLTRQDCIDYLAGLGLPVPPKSACVVCPYRSASEWLEMQESAPGEFAQAVAFDEANRHNPLADRGKSTADQLYIYKHALPLDQADLVADAGREKEKSRAFQLPLMCESGFCMV